MRLLVCGSREWSDGARVYREMAFIGPLDVVIHGAAPGADSLAGIAATNMVVPVLPFPADWSRGRRAGPGRNARMLADGRADRGLAFGALWRHVVGRAGQGWKRTGTGDMVKRMLDARLPVRWVTSPGAAAVDLTAMPEPPR